MPQEKYFTSINMYICVLKKESRFFHSFHDTEDKQKHIFINCINGFNNNLQSYSEMNTYFIKYNVYTFYNL